MPRVRGVKSLLASCVDEIVNNIYYWIKMYLETCREERKMTHLKFASPFVSLPSELLEKIVAGLRNMYWFNNRRGIELFLTPQLCTLDCAWLLYDQDDTKNMTSLFHLVTMRCPGLKVLKWKGNRDSILPLYQIFLPMFHKLQELHISRSGAGDDCLYILGTFCKDLRYLDVEGCPITDDGINGLCIGVDYLRMEEEKSGKCKSIHSLKMKETKITKTGVQLALDSLPDLKIFEFTNYVQILAELHEAAVERNPADIPTYPFTHLEWNDSSDCTSYIIPYTIGSLERTLLMCPLVTVVNIFEENGVTDTELQSLLALKRLRELCIEGDNDKITFDGGIIPLLKAFGNSLELLKLKELDCVNIRAIIEYCPNLSSLSLSNNCQYTSDQLEESQPSCSKRVRKELILENLKSLKLSCSRKDFEFSSEQLIWCLSSPQLVNLSINFCSELTDNILQQAVNLHHFCHLEHLDIFNCYHVSKKGIDLFMTESNPLKVINLVSCALLTEEHVDGWEDLIEERNWQTSIKFIKYE